MAKKKRKSSAKQKQGPARKLRAEVHSQLRVIASLFVPRILLTCLVSYPTTGYARAPTPPAVQPPQAPDAPPSTPHPPRAPAQPAPAQPASMELDCDSDSESDCDSEPESQSDSESEPEPEPVTQPTPWRCSARLAALAPAAPTGPPLPLDSEDPAMLRQLKDFNKFFANPNFLQSTTSCSGALCGLGLGLGAAVHGGYGINAQSSELQAATLDKTHVADLIEEANKQRRPLGMKKQGSLQDTLPLPCRMRHAVHVCRWLEQWHQPPTPPVPGQPKRGKRRGGPRTLTCPPPFTLTPMARCDTERWLAPTKPHLQHLAAASSAGTSLEANLKHITVTLATWEAVWEVYLDPKWARQRLRLYGAQDRALEQFFKKLEEDMAEVSMERHGHAKQLVVFFGAAEHWHWGPRGAGQRRGRVVLVDEHRTTRVSSAVNGLQPCEEELDHDQPTRPPTGPMQQQGHTYKQGSQPAASKPGPSTPPPAKRSKRTKAEQAAEPTQPTQPTEGKAVKAKPAPQPGRWLDRDCNAALNMQRIGESRWRPLELCYWPDQGALPAKGKEYPGLGYKRLRDKPPKAQQQQQQQPAEAQ
ncbi:hypothetical protein QJQ45_008550 [Haematococcus lacustris]|nr:hypothetical protein QJQ45_008550 [Haematococcus lacustris]